MSAKRQSSILLVTHRWCTHAHVKTALSKCILVIFYVGMYVVLQNMTKSLNIHKVSYSVFPYSRMMRQKHNFRFKGVRTRVKLILKFRAYERIYVLYN